MATMKLADMKLKIYDESNADELVGKVVVKRRQRARGLIPRDYTKDPVGCRAYAPRLTIEPTPRAAWDDLIDTQEKNESSLQHIRMRADNGKPMKSLDQNGQGYCWAYSVTGSVMICRAVAELPFQRLSAHAVGCQVKGFRDQGGWCTQSLDWIKSKGVPTIKYWKEKSMSRDNLTPEMAANASLNRIDEWDDMPENISAQRRFDLSATLLLQNRPVILDLNWWGHSVLGLRLVRISAGQYGILILNSWSDEWENMGMAVLAEPKGTYDGSCSPRNVTPAIAA